MAGMRFPQACFRVALVGSVFATFGLSACQSSDNVQSVFTIPASLTELAGSHFFDMPWPCDLRLNNGKVVFAGYPNPNNEMVLDEYTQFIDGKLDGFSPTAAGFLRFTGSLDTTSLPVDPADSMNDGAAVQLVDITKGSPTYQKKRPINVNYHDAAGVYWPAYTISVMPSVGYPLEPHTTYAIVVTDTLRSKAGIPVSPSPEVSELLGVQPPSTSVHQAAATQLAPFVTEINYVYDLKRIIHFSVFTTNDPTAEYQAAAKALPGAVKAPTADPTAWKLNGSNATYDEYVGMYGPSPNYQAGTIPFTNPGDGGGFVDDANGVPQVQNTFNLRFSLSIPNATKCPVPSSGYPIVMVAHGTGGDYETYVQDGTAKSLTSQCLAVMGVDQIFHGTRPGAPSPTDPNAESTEEVLVFNFNNIESARTTFRQSGLDEIQRERLFTETKMVVPASVSKTAMDIALDGQKLLFFGHSQGSLNGTLFLAASPASRGGVLSGASGLISITLLEKTQPAPSIEGLVEVLLGLTTADEQKELGIDHPAISLAQSIVDTVDPINYAAEIIARPGGAVSKSIYQTEGVRADGTGDDYAPPRGGEALALAMGLGLMAPPVWQPTDAKWMGAGLQPVTIPAGGLSGNIEGGMGTGLLAQFDPGMGEGHFVVFEVPQATAQAAGFLKNLANDPKGNVPPLQ